MMREVNVSTILLLVACICLIASEQMDESGCGVTTGCLDFPNKCSGNTCDMQLRWTPLGQDEVKFEMRAHTSGYVTVGFSEDDKMGDDSVMSCITGADGKVDLVTSKNSHRGNNILPLTEEESGVEHFSSTLRRGWIWCYFTRDARPNATAVADLDREYYVMLAYGPAFKGVMRKHTEVVVSSDKVNVLRSLSDTTQKPKEKKKKKKRSNFVVYAHGLMATAAWMCLIPIANVLGRFFKRSWPSRTLFGTKVWFTLHQYLTMSAIILTLVSITAIFVKANGYTYVPSKYSWIIKSHAPMGFSVVALSVFTALLSNIRCASRSSSRWMFDYSHMICGITSLILGLFCVYSGIKMMGMREICVYILSGYCVYLAITMFYLEFLRRKPPKPMVNVIIEEGKSKIAMTSPCEYMVIYSFVPISVSVFFVLCVYMFRWLQW